MHFRKNNPVTKNELIVLCTLSFIEFSAALVASILIPHETINGVFFGFSIQRFVLLLIISILASASLFFGLLSIRKFSKVRYFLLRIPKFTWITIFVLSAGFAILGWLFLLTSPDFWGKYSSYYERFKPLILSLGLSSFQLFFSYWLRTHQFKNFLLGLKKSIGSRGFWFTYGIILSVFIFFYITKWGVVLNTPLWNDPGVPISSFQIFFLIVTLTLFISFLFHIPIIRKLKLLKVAQILIPILIFITTCLIWGLTPLNGHAFSLVPNAPQFQPYPYSDARVHDLGAISIINGMGIYFHGFTDKPLYMAFLALFHLIAGNNYILLTWIQVIFLALIPVVGYYLGTKLADSFFGCLVAALIILQQQNAITLSRVISSVNVKLLVTEGFTLLGVVVLVYLLFCWFKRKSNHQTLLMGGIIGVLSLLRLNPILFLPFIGLILIITFWKSKKMIIKQGLIFLAGFLIVFSPWLLSGTDSEGQPWLFVKIKDVFQNRISPTLDKSNNMIESIPQANIWRGSSYQFSGKFLSSNPSTKLVNFNSMLVNTYKDASTSEGTLSDREQIPTYLALFGQHFSHNIVSAFMALPNTISYVRLIPLSQLSYWNDSDNWEGDLPFQQVVMFIFDILIISIGIIKSWKRHLWAGMAPLICFIIYDLALSFSLTSGGRYLVPINWIVFFYWGFGVYSILRFVFPLVNSSIFENEEIIPPKTTRLFNRQMTTSILILLIPGILILGSNVLIPFVTNKRTDPIPNEILETTGITINPAYTYKSGQLLYPYFDSNDFLFDFLINQPAQSYAVKNSRIINPDTFLTSGVDVIIGFNSDQYIKQIFVVENEKPWLFWSE